MVRVVFPKTSYWPLKPGYCGCWQRDQHGIRVPWFQKSFVFGNVKNIITWNNFPCVRLQALAKLLALLLDDFEYTMLKQTQQDGIGVVLTNVLH
jgi:hypothetical protein